MTPEQVYLAAREWVGVPYHHQGRVPAGLDCVGLLIVVARELGIIPAHFDYTRYGRRPNGQLDAALDEHLVPLDDPQPGCIVAIAWHRRLHHVGIVGQTDQYLTLIHALDPVGVIEHRLDEKYRRRIVKCYGYSGVTYQELAHV